MLGSDQYQALLDGAQITLQVSALAILWGTVTAVVLGVVSLSPFRPLRWFVRIYVEVLRGVSAIILIFWAYYALPLFGVDLSAMQAGVLALGLNLSAYVAAIVRGAVQAVPRGQTAAALAINPSGRPRPSAVVLPPAMVAVSPPYRHLPIRTTKLQNENP